MNKNIEQREGYKVITKTDARSVVKKPLFCPREECRKITTRLDDSYLEEYGFCKTCFIMLVEDRQTPAIDIEFYKNRLKERGY